MTRIEKVLRDVVEFLNARGQRYSLVGGLAVSARTEPRFTRDVDLALAVQSDTEAESVVHGLVQDSYSILATVEQDQTGRLATVRLLPPGEPPRGVVADLLFASSGIESEVVAAAEEVEILPGLALPVATVGHLIALKVLSAAANRPQDLADLHALSAVATAADLEVARSSVALMEARGFSRGKRLAEELAHLLTRE